MWNAIQGAAGNIATRASRLAVEVLDAGNPDQLKSHADLADGQERIESSGTVLNDRLSALKARYKSPTADGVSPQHRETVLEERFPVESSLDESSEVVRLKDQLERLKEELRRQSITSEETLKQKQFEWIEKMKQIEAQHVKDLQMTREEIMKHQQSQQQESAEPEDELRAELMQKNQQIEDLKRQITDKQQSEINAAFGISVSEEPESSQALEQLQTDYEDLMIKYHSLKETQSKMVNADKLSERDVFWKEEIQKLQEAHAQDMQSHEHSVQQDEQQSNELIQLQKEVQTLRKQCQQQQQEMESLEEQRQKSEDEASRVQQALEERDIIWQQELVSSQNEQQDIRKQLESTKREMVEEKEKRERLEKSYGELEADLKNAVELRDAAQAHVRSLQKSMMEVDSDAASVKKHLIDAKNEIERIKESYETRIQQDTTAFESQISSLQAENASLEETVQSQRQRLDNLTSECKTAQDALQAVKSAQENDAEDVLDAAKLKFDLETTAENLKLAESRNSILGHEIESLSQELDQLRQRRPSHQATITSDGEASEQLQKAEAERDSCKEQLKRLKQQMIQIQEDQEASLHWRVDAEVKLAMEEWKKKSDNEQGASKQHVSALQQELESLRSVQDQWQSQIDQKNTELQNLQIALGELTYHGEAADKLRRDLRVARDEKQSINTKLIDAKATVAEANSSRKAAEASADEAHRQLKAQEEKMQQMEGQLFSVKKELLDVSQKLRRMGNDEGTMVDRRLVVQLLVAYLEKRHQRDALDVMARMLGFTEEEKHRVTASLGGRGLLGGTLALVKGGMSVATLGLLDRGLNSETGSKLADQWVDFLIKEDEPLATEDPLAYLQRGSVPKHERRQRSSIDEKDSVRITSSDASASTHTIPRYEDFVGEKRTPDTFQYETAFKGRQIPPPFEAPQ